jgi:hypothetical protein
MAKGIPVLPVHDSIIVQGGELHAMALDRQWKRVTGAQPRLKPCRPSLPMELAGTKGHQDT